MCQLIPESSRVCGGGVSCSTAEAMRRKSGSLAKRPPLKSPPNTTNSPSSVGGNLPWWGPWTHHLRSARPPKCGRKAIGGRPRSQRHGSIGEFAVASATRAWLFSTASPSLALHPHTTWKASSSASWQRGHRTDGVSSPESRRRKIGHVRADAAARRNWASRISLSLRMSRRVRAVRPGQLPRARPPPHHRCSAAVASWARLV